MILPGTFVQPDIEQGLGAGDEHLIFGNNGLFIDLTGVESGTTTYSFADEVATAQLGDNDGELDFADTRTTFPCFAKGTLIETDAGPRPVETLTPGVGVLTADGAVLPIRWVQGRLAEFADTDDRHRPILFSPGSLDSDLPRRPLIVSPQHRIVVRTRCGALVLTPAKALLSRPGVRLMRGLSQTIYYAILLDQHAILLSEGAPTESFYPGPTVLRDLPPLQRATILRLFPALRTNPSGGYGPFALPVLSVTEGRSLPIPARPTPKSASARPGHVGKTIPAWSGAPVARGGDAVSAPPRLAV